MSESKIRATSKIVQELLDFVEEQEWNQYFIVPYGWDKGCAECRVSVYDTEIDREHQHKPGCHFATLLEEAKSFVRVEKLNQKYSVSISELDYDDI
jgi:hypothetical protein